MSFDAASPLVNTAYGQTYAHNFWSLVSLVTLWIEHLTQDLVGSDFTAPLASLLWKGLRWVTYVQWVQGDPRQEW